MFLSEINRKKQMVKDYYWNSLPELAAFKENRLTEEEWEFYRRLK